MSTSIVSDSGVAESVPSAGPSANSTQAECPSTPSNTSPNSSSANFSEISRGVLGLSDSSQTSSQAEKVSTEVEDDRWNSGVPSSGNQDSTDAGSSANSAMVHPSLEETGSHVSNFKQLKDQIPTLDSYKPTPASPVSMNTSPSPNHDGSHRRFTVGPPNATPYEEENIESTSDMVLSQKPEMVLTGDVKEDKKKIQNLESKMREYLKKINDLERRLASVTREKEEKERELIQAKEKIEKLEVEGAKATNAMQQRYEEEIKDLKKKIANTEKEKADQKEKYCKEIEELNAQLKEQQKTHYEKYIELMNDRHELDINVQKMKIREEKLRRELSDTKLEAAQLQHKLDRQASVKEMEVLRNQSSEALKQKDAEMKKREDEIRVLKQQISEMSTSSISSQGSYGDSKGDDQ